MSRPDLSLLLPPGSENPPEPSPPERPAPAVHRAEGPVAALIGELRAYQAELEVQNKVLRYSQAAAESASERFETLFASVPLSLMVLDEHDIVVQANSMAHRSFQPTEADRPVTSLMPFVSAADAGRVREAFAQAREHGHSEATEVVFQVGAANGNSNITGDLHIARIEAPQESGPPLLQFLCAVIDQGPLLTERQALQQSAQALQERNAQLHASERRLEAVINSALDAILCVDRHQRITVFNPTAAALFQCATADAMGSPLERFLPDAAQALAFAQLTTQAVLGEMVARTASGKELAVEVSMSFERHAEGETTTVFARDLTGRKKAEAHRSELEAQLRESHKMQAVGTMAGGIAHDFNNILSAILGNVELAKADCDAGSPVLESLHEIDKAGRRARDLVRQILTFSRNEPPQRTAVSVHDAVHDTERLLRVTLPPAIELRLRLDGELPPVLADATQVEQALLNLCTNAIHAIGEARGTVCVEASALEPDLRLCERLGLPLGEYVALTVVDNGPGIDAATQQRIFEPFFTTKPVGQGTGLGLAVVHGVMRTHSGAVDVHSTPGEGSRFTLYFPIAPDSVPRAVPLLPTTAAPVPAQPADARLRHVMYVDDDEALVFLVRRLLRRRGYQVTGFTDPHEATEALRADPAAYDLLVTDYNMPGYCGVDLVREAKRIRPDLPVALASGHVTAEIEQSALAEGASALIHKPNDVKELCATVHQLVHGSSAEGPDSIDGADARPGHGS
ncbi:PAS domain-containing hybrid sensor histidine kinase/response regulator [Paracidovorax valerianellae]|uniref:histidine kinase n=1 Tax=Paracidovorax valerianellae TaxID=187868 RepID=A0A1G6UVP2_9BURK|nr:ATP-binding protein [Paracidovorax valerianellae]MDA8446908.1 ATP-binding protein [Paracidovorax valerianellae]SDD45428.1 PAS domain S-box-containing protein [Paracidovorax valerianellae]